MASPVAYAWDLVITRGKGNDISSQQGEAGLTWMFGTSLGYLVLGLLMGREGRWGHLGEHSSDVRRSASGELLSSRGSDVRRRVIGRSLGWLKGLARLHS